MSILNHALLNLKKLRHKLLIQMYSMCPIQKNKLIFWSDSFKSYGCSPKYIAEYLLKYHPGSYDLVWVVDATLPLPEGLPDSIRVVRYFSKEYLYELHTAHFIICNARTGSAHMWHKRKGQIYIQTWHSSLRLKMIEKDAAEFLPQHYIADAIADSKRIDYLVSGCQFSSHIYRNSFWYDGKILECGTPRTDYLLHPPAKQELCRKLNLPEEYQYILYAPTFRDDESYDYSFDFSKLVTACEKRYGGTWKILYRLHPNLVHRIKPDSLHKACINACEFSDMQELVALCDMMITDYSSCMFDMAYTGKPCILFMPDYENYIRKERNLYFPIADLPFPKALTENELFDHLSVLDLKTYQQEIQRFFTQIGSFEQGLACEKIYEIIKGA